MRRVLALLLGSARLVESSADVVSELASTMTHDPASVVAKGVDAALR